ncbi:MAG: tyrosine-type recombinase/integrase [Planctomycetota bacterium]|jgi:integrase
MTHVCRVAWIELVFPSGSGGPTSRDNFRSRVFYKLLDKVNVPRFRFHDIRHTFASLLLAQGELLHYVKEQMGHASIQTTVDIYGHLVPGSNRRAMNLLDDPEDHTLRGRIVTMTMRALAFCWIDIILS